MARTREGSIVKRDKALYARVTFSDDSGKRREKWRRAKNKTHAKKLIKELLRALDSYGETALEGDRMTFRELADYFESNYVIRAQYVGDRKVAGYRCIDPLKTYLQTVRQFFGNRHIRTITRADLEKFKAARLATKTIRKRDRSIAAVNRELALLSRMFKVALNQGWLLKNPFLGGTSLISTADERIRQRILTREEEAQLLAACTGKRRYLRPLIICAIDTGLRRGELLKLRWSDIGFGEGIIIVQAFNTKTMKERQVAMTARLRSELDTLYEKNQDGLVFGGRDIRTAFESARRAAGLTDLRWHDLRHVHATRLVGAQIPLAEVGRVLGHSSPNMTYRYVSANVETVKKAAAALDDFNGDANPTDRRSRQSEDL